MNKALVAAAAAVAFYVSPASATVYTFDLTGTVASGSSATVDAGTERFEFFTISLSGFSPITLAVGDEIQAKITLDTGLTIPSAAIRNGFSLGLLNTFGATATTETSGTMELFLGGLLIADQSSGTSSTGAVFNSYGDFTGSSYSFDMLQSNFTITSLGAASLDVDTALLSSFTVNPIASVPEPATWGMMILGFGLVGSALRRKKASVRYA